MTAPTFQVGDRVSSTVEIFDVVHEGDLGTVVRVIEPKYAAPVYGVSWDHVRPMLHSCGGYCERGTGFFFVTGKRITLYHAPTIDQAGFLDLLRGDTYG